MALEAGSVVAVLKEECLIQEKRFLDKILTSVEVNENITTESTQHSIYYLPVWLCQCYIVVPTLCSLDPLLCTVSICSLHGKEILGCAIYFGEIHAQGQRELQQTPVDVLDQDNWEASTGYSSGKHVRDRQSWRTFKVSSFPFYIECVSSSL